MIRSSLVFSILLAAAPATLFSADEAPAALPVELRLLAFNSAIAVDEAHAHDPENPKAASVPVPVKTYLNHEFSVLPVNGRRVVLTAKADRGSLTRPGELLGEVTLPEGTRSAILLFLPAPAGNKARFKILPVDDSKKSFPAGSFRVFNLSPEAVRIQLEKKNFDFKPGQSDLIQDPPVGENLHSAMRAFAFHRNQWQSIATGLWPAPGEARVLQVMFLHPQTGQVQLRGFDDVPPRDPATVPSR